MKVDDNSIKICILAKNRTFNRCVKIDYKFSTVCEKNKKMSGPLRGGFFDSHCIPHFMKHFSCRYCDVIIIIVHIT